MLIQDLDTPSVVVDLDIMEHNIERMAAYCRTKNIQLRPHIKTHKIPEIARLQIQSGAIGITAAKLSEAEIMADAGISDILIAYPIVGKQKATRLANLAGRARITVSLDSEEAAREISSAAQERAVQVGVLVEIDVGMRRCGVADEGSVVRLAETVLSLKGLEFRGLMFYPGHLLVRHVERETLREQVNAQLEKALQALTRAGIRAGVVSGGSTPTAYSSHEFCGVTEIRPGMYLFNDRNMMGAGVASLDNCALSVLVTVVSKAVPGRIIVDGGSKTFSSDRLLVGDGAGFGFVREDSTAIMDSMSEEHGHLTILGSERHYQIGEHLTIVPNHVCTTINMHDQIYGFRGDKVETAWRVAARGGVR